MGKVKVVFHTRKYIRAKVTNLFKSLNQIILKSNSDKLKFLAEIKNHRDSLSNLNNEILQCIWSDDNSDTEN